PYALAALQGEVGVVIAAPEGQRNDTLNAASFALGTLVGAGLLDEHSVTDQLLQAALVAGLPEAEAQATIRSGLGAGRAQPRAVAR
ncbi:MAG: DNA primase, partial [Actinomycetota bacterium]|nr:DNA primase [Actinomycetota bacterium]